MSELQSCCRIRNTVGHRPITTFHGEVMFLILLVSHLNVSAWNREPEGDIDLEYILDGIKHGFSIVDDEVVYIPIDIHNHVSCTNGDTTHYPKYCAL